jgi:hypothetical protein
VRGGSGEERDDDEAAPGAPIGHHDRSARNRRAGE